MWQSFKHIRKFTPRSELERMVGAAKFQLEDRPVYYHGGGFAVYYSPVRFRVEGIQRVEYGPPGEYAVGLYHFANAETLRLALGLDSFNADDAAPFPGDILEGGVTYASTFRNVHDWMAARMPGCYQEGETWGTVNGKPAFLNRYIGCGQYQLFFYGKSKRTKLSGFQFAFCEEPQTKD